MFRQIVLTALVAGLGAGIFGWGLQLATTTPQIIAAEAYENSGGGDALGEETASETAQTDSHDSDDSVWMPDEGMERHVFTLLTSVLFGAGFGFVLVGIFALRGQSVGAHQGILWGLGGFAAFYVSPAMGLPPELPGMIAEGMQDRQIWWASAVVTCAVGLALMVFAAGWLWKLAGALLIATPHIIGAPHPEIDDLYNSLPPELAAQFAVTSLVTVGLFWIALGGLAGHFYDRFSDN